MGFLLLAALISLQACSHVPQQLRDGPPVSPTPVEVRADIVQHIGTTVRWGGTIAKIDNQPTNSLLELVSRPLSSSGRPQETDASNGRFLVLIEGFLDPIVYAAGRELTVIGQVQGLEQRTIGEYRYNYPMLHAQQYYLWQPRQSLQPDPFYYPAYPWPRHPYGHYWQ